MAGIQILGAGRSSSGTVSTYKCFDHSIDPAKWRRLHFGLFSMPTSVPQLVPQRLFGMCCLVYGKVHIKDPLLLIGESSLCGDGRVPLKKYVRMTICVLSSNNQRYENKCALEASLNKTNFPFGIRTPVLPHEEAAFFLIQTQRRRRVED